MWKYIDGEVNAFDFEKWIYATEGLESFFEPGFYQELIEFDYQNEANAGILRSKLVGFICEKQAHNSPISVKIRNTIYPKYGKVPYKLSVGHYYDVICVEIQKGNPPDEVLHFRLVDNFGGVIRIPQAIIDVLMVNSEKMEPGKGEKLLASIPDSFVVENLPDEVVSVCPKAMSILNYTGNLGFWEDFYHSSLEHEEADHIEARNQFRLTLRELSSESYLRYMGLKEGK